MVFDPYRNLSCPEPGMCVMPIAAHLYVPPIRWKGDPRGHIGSYDCFFFLISGECYVRVEDKSFVLKAGQLAFLPKGKMRTYTTMSEDFAMYEIAFEFSIGGRYWYDALGFGDRPVSVDTEDPSEVSRLFEDSVRHEYNKSLVYDVTCFANITRIIDIYVRARCEAEEKLYPFSGVIAYMESSLDRQLKVEELSRVACMQTTYFIKKFKSAMGMSPINYLNKLRIYRSMTLLVSTDLPVESIGKAVGIYDSSYFSKMFKKYSMISPAQYRRLFYKAT